MWYWVALNQVRMTKPQGGIRIFTLASHRSKGNNIVISLSHTVGCQAVLCFRTFSERIECRSNAASVADVPQWRMNKTDCRHQGIYHSEPRLQLWMCRDEEGDEKFPLFPGFVRSVLGFSPISCQWSPTCKRTKKGCGTKKVHEAVPPPAYVSKP